MNKSSEVISFQFDSQEVRSISTGTEEPLFVAKDVALVLGYSNASDAISRHCKGVAKHYPLQTAGGVQNVRIISEPDLYRLIAGSQLPSAEKFEKWIFEEVLPAIRKTGSYSVTPANPGRRPGMPDTIEPMVTQLKQSIEAAKSFGLEGDAMFDFAERIVTGVTGYSMKVVFGMNEWPKQQERPVLTLPAPPVDQALTVTQLSTLIGDGIGARGLNKLLCQKGIQERHFNDDGVIFYTPTEKGKPYAAFFDVAKRNGNKIQQLKWKPGVACLVS